MFAVDEGRDHIHRTWTIEGADGDDLFKFIEMQLTGQILHAARF